MDKNAVAVLLDVDEKLLAVRSLMLSLADTLNADFDADTAAGLIFLADTIADARRDIVRLTEKREENCAKTAPTPSGV